MRWRPLCYKGRELGFWKTDRSMGGIHEVRLMIRTKSFSPRHPAIQWLERNVSGILDPRGELILFVDAEKRREALRMVAWTLYKALMT